ncbi:MAG: deoxyuridine 5'-triphosphate nucleotidohydrolase [Chloroflexota bacterium]|nr:deoxyuridine 5'-triphosphate nucleotidohydrolase [Chloroflexota bacterium]
MTVLGRESLRQLLAAHPPLVEGLRAEAVQPHGIELTVRDVARFSAAGQLGVEDRERRLAVTIPLEFDDEGLIRLLPGGYLVTFNEVVNLPRHLMALGRPRSSLIRCGVSLHTAVWDAGYSGRSQSLLVVHHPEGFRLARNARILQLVFLVLDKAVGEGYQGLFQGENL